jgi:hypothetical protein
LAAVALLVGVDAPLAAKPMGRNLTFAAPPPVPLTTPNLGALSLPSQSIGAPIGNPGALGVINPGVASQQTFGALPGDPGSATFDPNAALPSLGNEGTSLRRRSAARRGVSTRPSTNATSTTP